MIERPAYYRLPRSRPVAFETPNQFCETINTSCCPKVQVVIKHDHNHSSQGDNLDQQRFSNNNNNYNTRKDKVFGGLINSMDNYNNLPKPFCRQSNQQQQQQLNYNLAHGQIAHSNQIQSFREHQHQQQQQNTDYLTQCQQQQSSTMQELPEIIINDQLSSNSLQQQQQQQPMIYPTSTVHKSMLNSSHNNVAVDSSNLAYSKLITPTRSPLTTISRSTTNAEVQKQKQQQNQAYNSGTIYSSTSNSSSWNSRTSQENAKEAASEFLQANLPSISGKTNKHQHHQSHTIMNANMNIDAKEGINLLGERRYQEGPHQRHHLDSNSVFPDTREREFMWNKRLERASIAHQTYRTLPIVMPKPKARHDLASGIYMRHVYDPTWDLTRSRPSSANKDYEKKIQEAIKNGDNVMRANGNNNNEGGGALSIGNICLPFGPGTSSQKQQQQNKLLGDELSITRETSGMRPATITITAGGCGVGSKNHSILEVSPAFNYKEYIESTRRAY